MEQFFDILSNLEVRFDQSLIPKSNDRTPTAVFQFISNNRSKFHVQLNGHSRLQFEAFYKHKDKFYPHPYILQTRINRLVLDTLNLEHYQQVIYDISLYLQLKRLQDFELDDLKRYYEIIDENVDINKELYDFHDVYLILHYEINGQSSRYECNHGRPIRLPKLISNPWTHKNTLIRFRYDAENRDGILPCEMTLHHGSIPNLESYKIVLCLTSNTIPARMDYHVIRWVCKFKPKLLRRIRSSIEFVDKEKSYFLNHSSGIIVAQVFGPDLKFTPQMLHPINDVNYVRSCYEPEHFRSDLQNAGNNDSASLTIVVIKGTEYPDHMKNRRKNKDIARFLPFKELDDVDKNLGTTNERIIKRLKTHKEQCSKQLILYDVNEKGTYSQTHVRLYAAAYDENDVLLTETLHPPLRNNKTHEPLHIVKIVQPKFELRANEPAFVYCKYDHSKSKPEHDTCPYEFELVFLQSSSRPDENQLLQLFNKPHICRQASYVPNCPDLLQFQVPNDPTYHNHRVFIRLRHIKSKDYDTSVVALNDNECWTYHAEPTSVEDMTVFDMINNAPSFDSTNTHQNIELSILPPNQNLFVECDLENSNEDSNDSVGRLDTPELESTTSRRFSFTDASSRYDNHE